MENPRFSLEEFKALFGDEAGSPDELQRRYESYLSALTGLDGSPVPPLTAEQKEDIFRQAWRQRQTSVEPPARAFAPFFRVAAVFALGTAFGCASMFAAMKNHPSPAPSPVPVQTVAAEPTAPSEAESPLKVKDTQEGRVYTGKAIRELYPQIENPKMVVEQASQKSEPRRLLYGTLQKGEITVVWNL
jgi:hypothetical protein